jgi:FtsP/CotA-like multicopper oxidase with cupredoxin domain
MERFMWGFDGKKFSEAEPIHLNLGERVRFVLINDTMMAHPIHLHGLWSELENGHGEFRPYKHTINVKPGEKLSYLVTADTPGRWAYHCHLIYHMEAGMFRVVVVS